MGLNALQNQFDREIERIGVDIKINNQDARAILKSVGNEYDDKEILTTFNMRQGYYVNYANKWWIIISETLDIRGGVYKKATMRKCEHNIKFIIDEKLYSFPALFSSSELALRDSKFWMIQGDHMTIRLPRTEISRKIKVKDRVIMFGSAFSSYGINEIRENIVEIKLWYELTDSQIDDMENEIGGRYTRTDRVDRLNGNITPIMPFDDESEIVQKSIITFHIIDKVTSESIEDITITLTDENDNILPLIGGEEYEIDRGIYTYTISKEGYKTVSDTIDLFEDTVKFILLEVGEEEPEEPEEPEELEILGIPELSIWGTRERIYTVNTDKPVKWSIVKGNVLKIVSSNDSECTVTYRDMNNLGLGTLRATLIEDETVFADLEIGVSFG